MYLGFSCYRFPSVLSCFLLVPTRLFRGSHVYTTCPSSLQFHLPKVPFRASEFRWDYPRLFGGMNHGYTEQTYRDRSTSERHARSSRQLRPALRNRSRGLPVRSAHPRAQSHRLLHRPSRSLRLEYFSYSSVFPRIAHSRVRQALRVW